MAERVIEKNELSPHRASRNLAAWSVLAGLLLWSVLAVPYFSDRIYTADDLGAFHLPIRAFYAQQLAQGQRLHGSLLCCRRLGLLTPLLSQT